MKHRNKNRPSPFPGQMSTRWLNLALVFCVYFVLFLCFWYYIVCLVFLGYCYFMLSVPVQLIAWKDCAWNDLLCVERVVEQHLTWSLCKIVWIPHTRHVTNITVKETTSCPPRPPVSSCIQGMVPLLQVRGASRFQTGSPPSLASQ